MKHERPLDPLNNLFVQYLLRTEENKDLLQHFVNAVLKQKNFPLVVSFELLNPFNIANFQYDKYTIGHQSQR